jgi:hypothetical protein
LWVNEIAYGPQLAQIKAESSGGYMRVTTLGKGLAAAALGICLAATPAAAQRGGFRGGGGMRGGFERGPARTIIVPSFRFYGGYGPRFYDPFWYGPYWGYPGYGYAVRSDMGQLKIKTQLKDAEVLIDGAYAGTTSERKSMWLRSGAHNIEIRAAGHEPFQKRIYLLSDKTITLTPGF